MPFAAAAVDMRPLSRLLKALADDTRLRIVALLAHGELCVCHIEQALDLKQANVSRQFAVLRAANVVAARRAGTWTYYQLAPQTDADCKRLLRTLVDSFAKRERLRKDVEKLIRVRGPGSCK